MCGPKGFMDKMAELLHTKGVQPQQIRYERFN
jgi:ferredoxin-NADP reductase